MKYTVGTYILGGLIFLLLFFIVLTFIMRKREDKITDEFGKESNYAEESLHKTETFYRNEKTAHTKKSSSAEEFKKIKKQFEKKQREIQTGAVSKTAGLLNIVIIFVIIYAASKLLFFIIYNTNGNHEAFRIAAGLGNASNIMFIVIALYGMVKKRKEGVLLIILFFIGNFAGYTGYIINIIMWLFVGSIFKGNYTVKFSAFIAMVLTGINALLSIMLTHSDAFSFVGTVSVNPAFSTLIQAVGVLQALVFLAGLLFEKKKLLSKI